MKPDLSSPPPLLWKIFSWFYWGLILTVCLIVLLLMACLALLAIAFVVGWIASLVS